ncbi:MAG: glucosyl transferase [Leptolyngbya foveolarum]|uniref:Glucosyl transferase n=1 Tax=Leptolyngbya foveolarum TaxID=47253 RepID=A0A2W4UW33_9CYAN|nr:MAG: glucosyl transferase [Leptolyngbya foveolarum]
MKTTLESNPQVVVSTADHSNPLVSILINNYNYGCYLTQAVDSALNQTYTNTEVIVVDDGSTDNSPELIESYGDRIIAVIKKNGGQASAMNAGFAASSGQIICLLDADDLFLPEKAAYVADCFQKNPNVDWVFTESAPLKPIEIDNIDLTTVFREVRTKSLQTQSKEINFCQGVLSGKIPDFPPSTSNLCFSRRVLDKIFPLPEIRGTSGMAITDLYIHTLAIGLSSGYSTKQDLGIYRCHEVNMSLSFQKRRKRVGEININTGYWIQENFPQFRDISNKFVSKGFATYLSSNYLESRKAEVSCEELLKSYLEKASFLMKLKILLMISYYWIRLRFNKFV